MKLKLKKGQTSEFIGITLLVIVLVFILLFSKLSQGRNRLIRTEGSVSEFKNMFIATSVTKFPYITNKGVSINEMMGAFMCYKQEKVDYGSLGEIEVIAFPREQLDELYGNGNWKLELDESYCLDSNVLIPEKCDFFKKEFITYEFYFSLPCKVEISYGKIYLSI